IRAGGGEVLGPTVIAAITIPLAIVAGDQLTCAVTNERHVRCWGNRELIVDKEGGGPLTNVTAVALGPTFGCALAPSGTYCWGKRYYGQLGIGGDETADVVPFGKPTSLSKPVRNLVAGVAHTCALLMDGSVTCFGLNSLGQVGPGADTRADEVRRPAPVTGFSGRVM